MGSLVVLMGAYARASDSDAFLDDPSILAPDLNTFVEFRF
jgi:hypothetical protein